MNNSNSSTGLIKYFAVMRTLNLVTLAITLPAILFAIYVVYQQIRLNQAVHVYVINLLISDILQFVGILGFFITRNDILFIIFLNIVGVAILLSVSFMICIAVERYLMIAHPLWYSIHCTVKCSILTSVGVWMIIIALNSLGILFLHMFPVLLILPFPLLLFLFVGTWRGLSKALTLSTREKRRILATLGLVIGSYTFIFLPAIIAFLAGQSVPYYFGHAAQSFVYLNPLSDLLLYIFLRKDTRRILEDIPCCRRAQTDHEATDQTAVTSL